MTINGLARLMTKQYLAQQGFNGEGTIKMFYGTYPGNDASRNLPGWAPIINGTYHTNVSSLYLYYPWYYYYRIIGNANALIVNIENANGTDAEKQRVKAQALTYRAYSFLMLSQLYCDRWVDSNNGSSKGIVLRIDESTGELAPATLAETYAQIYADLDEAITLFTSSKYERAADNVWDPNINVAYATYARAAITKGDWANASKYAKLAYDGYPLMSVSEYQAGFCLPNQEWIWGCYGGSEQSLFYYQFGAYIAYNSTASIVRSYPVCISKELLEQMDESDIRRGLFLDPKEDTYNQSTGAAGAELNTRARSMFPAIASNATVYAYMNLKFKCTDAPGVGYLNNFRSSEMYLIEAEAEYHLNNTANAKNALIKLVKESGRNPEYTCDATGEDLLKEIKFQRRVELWGEGFDWFDLKRWKDGISRKSFKDGGNFVSTLDVTVEPTAENNWVWMYPKKETDFNKLAQ